MTVHDDGSGLQLYATGYNGLQRWNGTAWQMLVTASNFRPTCMASWDDGLGGGPKLYTSPIVISIGGPDVLEIWDGHTLQNDPGLDVYGADCLTVWDDGLGPALFASGSFTHSGSYAASDFARLGPTGAIGCTLVTGTPYCFGDGSGTTCPCGNNGSMQHGCANSNDAAGAVLVAEGQAHLSSDTVTLRASGMTPSTTLLFFQGTGQAAGGQGVAFGDGLRCVNARSCAWRSGRRALEQPRSGMRSPAIRPCRRPVFSRGDGPRATTSVVSGCAAVLQRVELQPHERRVDSLGTLNARTRCAVPAGLWA